MKLLPRWVVAMLCLSAPNIEANQINIIFEDVDALVFRVQWDRDPLFPVASLLNPISTGFLKADFSADSFLITASFTIDGIAALDEILVRFPLANQPQSLRIEDRIMYLAEIEPYGAWSTTSSATITYGNYTPGRGVPDGGSTTLLLGIGLACLMALSRTGVMAAPAYRR